jgi:hypothetical protein
MVPAIKVCIEEAAQIREIRTVWLDFKVLAFSGRPRVHFEKPFDFLGICAYKGLRWILQALILLVRRSPVERYSSDLLEFSS